MADLRKHAASDDYELISGAGTFLLGATLAGAGGGELFVAQIGGTGFTHVDVSAAITAYNAVTAKRAIFHIADVAAGWGSIETISKPIKFVGIIEGAGIGGSTPPNINFADTAQPEIQFENLALNTSGGDGSVDIFDSTILSFTNCFLNNTGDTGATMFAMVGAAGGIGLLTIRAKDSFFECEAGGAGNAILFSNAKTDGDIEFHLEHCTFFNLSGGASAGILALTDNGGSIFVFLKDGTVLHRPGFNTSGAGAENLEITYDGSCLVTDYISGGTESQANVIGGTTTISGEAAYNTIMDVLDADLNIQRALTEFLGSELRVSAGTYTTTTAIVISASDKVIRAAGKHVTVIDVNAGGPVTLNVSGSRNVLSGLTLTTNTAIPGSILRLSGNDNVVEDVKILVPNVGVWTASILVDLTGNQNRLQHTLIDPVGRAILTAVRLSGTENYVYKVTYRPSNNGDATTVFESATAGTRSVFEHNVIDLTGTSTITQAFLVGADDTVVSLNNLYSGGAAAIGAGILTATTPSGVVIHMNKIDEDVGTGTVGIDCVGMINSLVSDNWVSGFGTGLRSDVNCADNMYANNHLRDNSTPTSLNATDLTTSESTDNLE